MKKILFMCAFGFAMMGAHAEDRPAPSAEMKAAFESCQSQGKPGSSAFDTCMSGKGFTKPAHNKERHEPRGDMPAGLKAALDACKIKGKPGDSTFEACMTEKGFTKPSK